MTQTRPSGSGGAPTCDEMIACQAAHIIGETADTGALRVQSDIAAALRDWRLEDALNLHRANLRARMLGGINRARSGFDRDQRSLLNMVERRAHPRTVTLLTAGTVSAERRGPQPCMVRDLSEGGARIETAACFAVGARISLEVRGLRATYARVRWYDGRFHGLQFDRPQNLQAILSASMRREQEVPRGPRHFFAAAAEVRAEDRGFAMTALDISLGGMKLRGECDLAPGVEVQITLDGESAPLRGHVRWADGGAIGVAFVASLFPAQLEALLARGR